MSQPDAAQPFITPVLDYGRSFICTLGPLNYPRFWVESRCRIENPPTSLVREFYQCGSCKAEDTFADRNLIRDPNYDFLPVFSEDDLVIFRRHARCVEDSAHPDAPPAADPDRTPPDRYREVRPMKGHPAWGGLDLRLRQAEARPLTTPAEVIEAAMAGLPLIGQTLLTDETTGTRAVIEYPIKTINLHPDRRLWQVDTGPVVLPDIAAPPERWPQALELAFIVFNCYEWIEVIVEAPTPLRCGGRELARVYHYSDIRRIEAPSILLAQQI